jgi:very-short-patch-repair endonuclease
MGVKFRRQHQPGTYIAAFYSRDAGLVVGSHESRLGHPTGKIAVKVINHFGDEVLKVFSISG